MSGLFGYLGRNRCQPVLVQGLKLMQDFSFDSGGVLLKGDGEFFTQRVLGSSSELEKSIAGYEGNEKIGGAHLRWATHGEVAQKNVHPIFSCDGKVAVMHKGLISNYKQIKKILQNEGHIFKTETDTEVMAHLIEKYYEGDLTVAVRRSLLEIDGTYGLLVFYKDDAAEMVAANAGMGMVVGLGQNEYWISTSNRVIHPFTDKVVYLNDGEMVKITPEGFVTSVIAGGSINVVSKYVETLNQSTSGIDEYFNRIEKEIFDLPEMVENILAGRLDYQKASIHFGGLSNYQEWLRNVNRAVFIGSGSSYYTTMMARELMEDNVRFSIGAYSGIDFVDKKHALGNDKVAVFIISQSGSTNDTVAALEEAKQHGLPVFGMTNTVGSRVARLTEAGIFLHSGPTLGMPSVKSFLSQLITLVMLTIYIGRLRGMTSGKAMKVMRLLESLPSHLKIVINNAYLIKQLVNRYKNYTEYVVVGSKFCYPIAKEVALFMSEIADVRAEGVDYSEIKYGLINRINQNTMVLLMLPDDDFFFERGKKIACELKKRGAKVVVFVSEKNAQMDGMFEEKVVVPATHKMIVPALFLAASQIWAFQLGKEKNITSTLTGDQVMADDDYGDVYF